MRVHCSPSLPPSNAAFSDGRIFEIEHEDKQNDGEGRPKNFQAQQDLRHAVHYVSLANLFFVHSGYWDSIIQNNIGGVLYR